MKRKSFAGHKNKNDLPLALSVHYLRTTFLQEVLSTPGLSKKSTIYDIENLDEATPGVIRSKGLDIDCPHDGRPGAAYVDCVHGRDNVGPARYMLSYSWAYRLTDILDTLSEYCFQNRRNPRRTYVWICCLCNNQHRVYENRQAGEVVPFEEFRDVFFGRVTKIGHILAMMQPWHSPTYLQRVWCIFELTTAESHGCQLSIVMPPKEKDSLDNHLFGTKGKSLDAFFRVLARTSVEDAQASVENDRTAILKVVMEGMGCAALNQRVNELLRLWLDGVVHDIIAYRQDLQDYFGDNCGSMAHARFCSRVCVLFHKNGRNPQEALEWGNKAIEIHSAKNNPQVHEIAACYSHVGNVQTSMGELDQALASYEQGFDVLAVYLRNKHPAIASEYAFITGNVLRRRQQQQKTHGRMDYKRDYDYVLGLHKRRLAKPNTRKQNVLAEQDNKNNKKVEPIIWRTMATIHNNIAHICMELDDEDGALARAYMALALIEYVVGDTDHVEAARSHEIRGSILEQHEDHAGALDLYRRALGMRKNVQGKHPETAQSLYRVACMWHSNSEHDRALEKHREALVIRKAVLGATHLDTAASHEAIGDVLHFMGDHTESLVEYRIALAIKASLLGDGPDTARLRICMGDTCKDAQDFDGALEHAADRISSMVETMLAIVADARTNHDHDRAMELCERAFAIQKYHSPEDSAGICGLIGDILVDQGYYPLAIDRYKACLSAPLADTGKPSLDTATFYDKLANALLLDGDCNAALGEYENALDVREDLLGNTHLAIAETYERMGIAALKDDNLKFAQYAYGEAVAVTRLLPDMPDLQKASACDRFGAAFLEGGYTDIALVYYREALRFKTAALGQHDLFVADAHEKIGDLLYEKGEFHAGKEAFQSMLTIRKELLGEDSVTMAESYSRVGNALLDTADYSGAAEAYRNALAIYEKVQGPGSDSANIVFQNLKKAMKKEAQGLLVIKGKSLAKLRIGSKGKRKSRRASGKSIQTI
ncbi:repeat-containing protein [Seminavis robusta]|uniref:Repeat-containing protein n=1 Tax=Seminavis robusta TaxID=568900 RepID=A0A9N8HKI5_9STRA|nr:repeat-containing protein [Seminavis robusta]|eukprot:Sro842_g209680.1 repeat-containing protein (997) ;mRNA; r:13931-17241